jgi:hypothetical protein
MLILLSLWYGKLCTGINHQKNLEFKYSIALLLNFEEVVRYLSIPKQILQRRTRFLVVVGRRTRFLVVVGRRTRFFVVVGRRTRFFVVFGRRTRFLVVVGRRTLFLVVVEIGSTPPSSHT